jgi:preprotein translocase subunit SecG
MDTSLQNLPFVPPVEGCKIEHIRRVGPFITQVRLRLPDGKPYVWTSRGHRFSGGGQSLSAGTDDGSDAAHWWHIASLLARIIWWVSAFFVIGSLCFALSSSAGLAPGIFGAFGSSVAAMNLVFFVGSIFFTVAAYLQFLAAVNADRISAIVHRKRPQESFRWFALRPGEIGWLSAFTQLVGTVLFNVNTFDALLPGLDWLQEDLLIWVPDALGSVCFLAASALALLEYGNGRFGWRPRDVSWWIVNINMLGSIAFGLAAVYALVLPVTADLLDVWAVNAWTVAGALCFLIGAYLLLPEVGRNLRAAAVHPPAR